MAQTASRTQKRAEEKSLGKKYSRVHLASVSDFCSVVENVTFGIRDGKTFALMSSDWTPADRAEWAKANALFFQGVMDRLNKWGALVAKENGLDY